MEEKELYQKLQAFVGNRTLLIAAKELGISRSYLYEIMRGSRKVACPAILRHFKLKKTVTIREK